MTGQTVAILKDCASSDLARLFNHQGDGDGLLLPDNRQPKGRGMTDFASTVLINLLQQVVAEADPELVAGDARADPFFRGIGPEAYKRDLVNRVLDKHGPGLLLCIGQHLHLVEETPTVSVFRQSTDPQVLADKWSRFERYHHASHRTTIQPSGPEGWSCHRHSTGSAPGKGENCLIAGLLLGLVGMTGVEDCRLQIAGLEIAAADLRQAEIPPDATFETFRILWSPGSHLAATPDAGPETGTIMVDRLAGLLATDVGRNWKIADVAKLMAVSTRSLQRHLKSDGRSFSTVLRRARLRQATDMLTTSAASLAEIGYCCGYADQAHFQRDFLRITNITPKRFRQMSGSRQLA